ncbi:MAG: SirA family protein [Gammaproteobacteria bacterium]|nr:SirA family protein [Gammaproteobacteria bacterium]
MQTQETIAGIRFDQTLDAKGLNCPLPVLKAKLALNRMQAGEILHARTGHEIIQSTETDGVIEFFIRRTINPNKI